MGDVVEMKARCLFCRRPYRLKSNLRYPLHVAGKSKIAERYKSVVDGKERELCWGSDLTVEEQRRKAGSRVAPFDVLVIER